MSEQPLFPEEFQEFWTFVQSSEEGQSIDIEEAIVQWNAEHMHRHFLEEHGVSGHPDAAPHERIAIVFKLPDGTEVGEGHQHYQVLIHTLMEDMTQTYLAAIQGHEHPNINYVQE